MRPWLTILGGSDVCFFEPEHLMPVRDSPEFLLSTVMTDKFSGSGSFVNLDPKWAQWEAELLAMGNIMVKGSSWQHLKPLINLSIIKNGTLRASYDVIGR